MRLLLCREGYTNEERARCCLQSKQKSCGEMNISRNGHRGSCPHRACSKKSNQVRGLYCFIYALSIIRSFCTNLISFYLSAFNSFLAIFFFGSSSSILWSNKVSKKQCPPFLALTPNCLARAARNAINTLSLPFGSSHHTVESRRSSIASSPLYWPPSSTSFLADSISTIIEEPTIQPVPRKSASWLWLLDQRRWCLLMLCRKF